MLLIAPVGAYVASVTRASGTVSALEFPVDLLTSIDKHVGMGSVPDQDAVVERRLDLSGLVHHVHDQPASSAWSVGREHSPEGVRGIRGARPGLRCRAERWWNVCTRRWRSSALTMVAIPSKPIISATATITHRGRVAADRVAGTNGRQKQRARTRPTSSPGTTSALNIVAETTTRCS